MKDNKFPFQPLNDQIVVEIDTSPGVSKGGIIIPETSQSKMQTGTVIAVGPGGILPDGSRHQMSSTAGRYVYVKAFSGTEIEIDGKKYSVMSEEAVLGFLSEEYVAEQRRIQEEAEAAAKLLEEKQLPKLSAVAGSALE